MAVETTWTNQLSRSSCNLQLSPGLSHSGRIRVVDPSSVSAFSYLDNM
jgi:hypothetical protein